MLIIPAVDIKSGKCVRLWQGSFNRVDIYGDNPVAMALKWEEEGAQMLHVVDLDAAVTGKPLNKAYITEILKTIHIPVQVGGGIRNSEIAQYYIQQGARSIVLTTLAYEQPDEVINIAKLYPDQISIGVDVLSGAIAIKGWTQSSNITPNEFIKRFEHVPIYAFVFTDIYKDGTLSGIELTRLSRMLEGINVPVIISGGISSILDIKKLKNIGNRHIKGVIIGRALYTGAIKLKEVMQEM